MPLYTFENIETLEQTTELLSIADREVFLKNNPKLRQVLTGFAIADPMRLNPTKSMPSQAKERFDQIRKMNPGHTMG